MSNVQRPLNTSYTRALAEQRASREREAIFLREHFKASIVFEPGTGTPGPAQKPVGEPKSIKPGMSPDVDDGLKA